ncbi:MAG: RNA methyltransferase [Chlamydiota bacterium]|nr:RNA methyltransferase [Chlamydiota bacterium]
MLETYGHVTQLINEFGIESVISTLLPFMTDERMVKIDSILQQRIGSIHVAVESPYDIHNAYAIVRSAEAMGVNNVHIISSELKKSRGKKTAGGTNRWMNVFKYRELDPFISMMEQGNIALAGASPKGTVQLSEIPVDKPICLVFGNEHRGLTDQLLDQCDIQYQIPMFGMAESLNLSVSAGISLYDIVRRKRHSMKGQGDLTESEKELEKAKYLIRSLGVKFSTAVLNKD